MVFAFLYSWLRLFFDLVDLGLRVGDSEAELLLLGHQLRVVRRREATTIRAGGPGRSLLH
jgi:hypothetical protein